MKTIIFCILTTLFSFSSLAQDQAVRNTILQKLDAFKEKSLAITNPALSFNEVVQYQQDLYAMFLTDDVLIEAGVKQGKEEKVPQRVYRADELGAWLRSLSRSQAINMQGIDYQQIEIYWISAIEKVNSQTYKLRAWVLPWDRIAYKEGDFRKMPGVREVTRELPKSRLEAIMASGEEVFISYLRMSLLDRAVATNPNMRSSGGQQETIHTVQPGETLFSIAMKHDVEIGDIMADNNLSTTTIHSGENLVIGKNQYTRPQTDSRLPDYLQNQRVANASPVNNNSNYRSSYQPGTDTRQYTPERPLVFRPIYYTVKEYDNARSIAYKFGLEYAQILEWNPQIKFKQGDKVIVDMLAID